MKEQHRDNGGFPLKQLVGRLSEHNDIIPVNKENTFEVYNSLRRIMYIILFLLYYINFKYFTIYVYYFK